MTSERRDSTPIPPSADRCHWTLAQALAYIDELETALETALWGTQAEWRRVKEALSLSRSESQLLVALWKANGVGLTHAELDRAIPYDPNNPRSLDPEMRTTMGSIKQFIYRIRRHHPELLAPPRKGRAGQVKLTPEGRARLGEILSQREGS